LKSLEVDLIDYSITPILLNWLLDQGKFWFKMSFELQKVVMHIPKAFYLNLGLLWIKSSSCTNIAIGWMHEHELWIMSMNNEHVNLTLVSKEKKIKKSYHLDKIFFPCMQNYFVYVTKFSHLNLWNILMIKILFS
jgi:hypothetical protein